MIFRNREEMEKYVSYLKSREIRRKMSLRRVILMLVISVVVTVLAFVLKDGLTINPEEEIVIEKLSYCLWCLFMVILTRGIIRVNDFDGLRKFAVILSGTLSAALIVMFENLLLMYAPNYHYITFNAFFESLVSDFINDGIYGTLRFPVMIAVTILVSYVYSSEAYSRFVKKFSEKLGSLYTDRIRPKLIDMFSVTDVYEEE